jgi:hypothetical protein
MMMIAMTIDWKPVSKTALIIGVGAAALFFVHAATDKSGFLILDHVNLPIHEAGHPLFGLLGGKIGVWGGTLMELLVPLLFAFYFLRRGETSGTAFCSFWFGENFLYISAYIADARALALPLVGGGEHDWNLILSDLHLLQQDTMIGDIVRVLGWAIMVGSVAWFISKRDRSEARREEDRLSRPPGPRYE